MATHKECAVMVLNHLLSHYEDFVTPDDVVDIVRAKYPQERVGNVKIRHIDEHFMKLRRRIFKMNAKYMKGRGHDIIKELNELEGVADE
jgi:hypothetical protein